VIPGIWATVVASLVSAASTHRDKRQEIVPTNALCVYLRVMAEIREALNKVIVNLRSGR
jgi:hypothetical protein